MNYELFMSEALAEGRAALSRGERPHAAVAVVSDAMVARAHDRVEETGDPTAHAVILALREAARRLGRERLADICPYACAGRPLSRDLRPSSDGDGDQRSVATVKQ